MFARPELSLTVASLMALTVISVLGSNDLRAQEVDVPAAIACYEAKLIDSFRPRDQRSRPACPPGVYAAPAYLVPGEYDRLTIEAVLDGFAELAVSSQNRSVRVRATSRIAGGGAVGRELGVPIVPRLMDLFENAPDPSVRITALNGLQRQADVHAAAEALGVIAAQAPELAPPHHQSYPTMAVDHLQRIGPEGHTVLRQLISQDRLGHPGIRALVVATLQRLERSPG